MPEKLRIIQNKINNKAQLIAVSKFRTIDEILHLYHLGQRHFAENRVQELMEKKDKLPNDILWHVIGTLQSNKVKYIAPFVHCIHSVDGEKLAVEINKQAQKQNRIIHALFQLHIAQEDTKQGFQPDELIDLLNRQVLQSLSNINWVGVMAMATNTKNSKQIESEFHQTKLIFDKIKQDFFSDKPDFKELSMGMSGDYEIALQQGATIVRIGSLLF